MLAESRYKVYTMDQISAFAFASILDLIVLSRQLVSQSLAVYSMLTDQQFRQWCNRSKLFNRTCILIQNIRSSEPVRHVNGGRNNVCGRYPSQKMGRTIQFESHKVELPAIEDYEANDNVLEYYDQPFKLKLSYRSKNGRKVVCSHTPDFLVLRESSIGFEEWKPEARLKKLAEKQPNRCCVDTDGNWHSPPAQECIEELGVYYRLRTDSEVGIKAIPKSIV